MTEKSSTIEVAARDLIQLFNSLDPSPFPERDLDDEAEAFIVSWAKELSPTDRFRIVIHLPMPELIKAEQQDSGRRFQIISPIARKCSAAPSARVFAWGAVFSLLVFWS